MANNITNIGVPGGFPLAIDRPTKGIPLPEVNMSTLGLREYGPTKEQLKSQKTASFIDKFSSILSAFSKTGFARTLADFGLDLVGGAIQNKWQKDAESRANAEWQRRFDLENVYNHPLAQANRFRQAGINPLSGLGLSTPAGSPAVSLSSAPEGPNGTPIAGNEQVLAQQNLAVAQALTETYKQNLLQSEKENLISKTHGQDLANAFEGLVFEHKVQDFKNKVRLVANDLSRSDMALPLYQYTIALDILLQNQKLQIGEFEMAQMYANILNINADTKLKQQYTQNLKLEFQKFDWEQKKFFFDKFFELQKQYNNFAHEKEMLEMSQRFNAIQNAKEREVKYGHELNTLFDTLLDHTDDIAFVVGAILTATGAGSGVGIPLMLGAGGSMLLSE